jgi:hypothetical protein
MAAMMIYRHGWGDKESRIEIVGKCQDDKLSFRLVVLYGDGVMVSGRMRREGYSDREVMRVDGYAHWLQEAAALPSHIVMPFSVTSQLCLLLCKQSTSFQPHLYSQQLGTTGTKNSRGSQCIRCYLMPNRPNDGSSPSNSLVLRHTSTTSHLIYHPVSPVVVHLDVLLLRVVFQDL